jgi:hypothetical protein
MRERLAKVDNREFLWPPKSYVKRDTHEHVSCNGGVITRIDRNVA